MEVALAATVLALALVGMIGVVEQGSQMLDLSRKQLLAAQILHGEIEELRLQNWTVVAGQQVGAITSFRGDTQVGTGGTSFYILPGNGYPAGPTTLTASNDPFLAQFYAGYPNGATIFTVTRTVACVQPSQANNNPISYSSTPLLLQVTFTVQWKGITGISYSRTSTTLVGQYGLSATYQRS
jgi:hypothetical protein